MSSPPPGTGPPTRLTSLRRDPSLTLGGVQKVCLLGRRSLFLCHSSKNLRQLLHHCKSTGRLSKRICLLKFFHYDTYRHRDNVDELLSGDLPELLREPTRREKRTQQKRKPARSSAGFLLMSSFQCLPTDRNHDRRASGRVRWCEFERGQTLCERCTKTSCIRSDLFPMELLLTL